jgi:hypothetical protein
MRPDVFGIRALVLSLLICGAAQAKFTQVQEASGSAACLSSTLTSCAVTIAPTGSGHILIAVFELQSAGSSVSAVSGGGTWVHAPNCAVSASALDVDCWYVLNSTPGAAAITAKVTSGSARGVEFYEFSIGAGCSAAFDSSGSSDNSTTTSGQPGVGLTLTGFNDVIVQGIYTGTAVSSISGGYTVSAASSATNRLAALLLNTASGAAPIWTIASSQPAAVNAIAISESCPVSSITVSPTQMTMSASQVQQFAATETGSANALVNWSVNPPVGTISSSGVYTAPGSIASSQTITVKAASAANPSFSASASVTLTASSALAAFPLNELFGVAWTDQPIEFRYDGGQPPTATTRMLGPLGTEVPYQWVTSCSDATAVKGCIAVRSNLPANASYTWTLQSGIAPAATVVNPVRLNQVGNNYEITNGLTGVRIVTAAANPSPHNLAPIQGIWMPGGTWTGAGAAPNLLYSESSTGQGPGCIGCALRTPMYTATSYTVTVVDSGPLKTVLKVNYSFNRPRYAYGGEVINTAGAGHYTLIATLYANSKSVLLDEDTDMQFSYYLPVYAQVQPSTALWRGHDAVDGFGNANPACGYESPLNVTGATNATPVVITTATSGSLSNGQAVLIAGVPGNTAANGNYYAKTTGYSANQFALYRDAALTMPVAGTGAYGGGGTVKPAYRGESLNALGNALQDLTYTADRPASYQCIGAAGGGNNPSYQKLLADYPAASHAAGWRVEMYNAGAGTAAPLLGFYIGRASKQLYSATGPSLPGIYTSNSHWITGAQAAGLQVDTLLRGPSNSTPCPAALPCEAVVHRNWGIFSGTQADMVTPGAGVIDPFGNEQNTLTGINLSRLYTYQLVYPDPPGGWQWLYLSAAGAAQLQSWVQNGTPVCGSPNCYAALLNSSEGSAAGQALIAMWQATTPAAGQAAVQTALNSATTLAYGLVHVLVYGDNHFDQTVGYYGLGLQTSPAMVVLNAILVNPNTTPAQKTLAKAELALFGCIFWDDDWFPIDNNSGESVGLANQVQQYLQYRTQSVLSDPSQPFLSLQLPTALSYSTADFAAYFSPTGAAAGSTHYQSAFFEPLIVNYMDQATPGLLPLSDPAWAAYANWELSIQTPPEPRFGNLRKGYSNGDGNTEADVRTGMLGTALYPVNASLAGNLMWAWQQSNSASRLTEDSQFVTTLAVIDPAIPAVTPQLSSINIPGYHSVERFNFGTPQETALWFINGGFYQVGGHRHYDDGQVSIYALSAPLAIDWNANLYNPETPGRFMHDSIVYDSELPHLWSADQPSLADASTLMRNPVSTEFAAFKNSTTATGTFTAADGTVWTRIVRTMAFDPAYPIIYVTDQFAGPSAGTGKTLTWNMMAGGAVSTPAGSVTPAIRFSAGCQSPAGALPSDGAVFPLNAGLQRFNFTGVAWPQHPAGGIDWDLFTVPNDATGQFLIGNWGHGCHPVREASEFQQANGVPFAETQHILRVHDDGGFTTLILPYAKTAPPVRTVTQQGCGTQVVQTSLAGVETTCFSGSAAQYSNGILANILTVYDGSTQSAFGVTVSGGPQEVVVGATQIEWTISGVEAGTRTLTLPAGWAPTTTLAQTGNTFTTSFSGGAQTTPVSFVFGRTK